MKSYSLLTFALIVLSSPFLLIAQDKSISPSLIITGLYHGETLPLRDIPALTNAEWQLIVDKAERKMLNPKLRTRSYPFAETALPKGPDPVWQQEMVAGPANMNTLFTTVTGANCNDGDPLVLFDEQADRWLAVEFSICGSNDYMLIAVSTTNDPTGTWHKYSFDVADMPDYEKFGIWQDGYYMGTNNGSGNDIYVFERSKMLLGLDAQAVGFNNPWRPATIDGFMCVPPLDNDGAFAPAGEPGLFITINDDAIGGGSDQLWIYELDVNWTTPASSTFTRSQQLNIATFDSDFGNNRDNIKQLGTSQKLDGIPQVIMNPPQYRNFGAYKTIVCCHTVDVDATDHAGIRWYELRRVSSGDWTIRQQGTFAPDLNFSSYTTVNLTFQLYFVAYSGSSASLHYSVDGGNTWSLIQTWTTTTANAATFSQDLASQVGGQANVRFKWNYTGTWGYDHRNELQQLDNERLSPNDSYGQLHCKSGI